MQIHSQQKVSEKEKLIKQIEENIEQEKEKIEKLIIEIPKIMIVPAETKAWFEDFDLDVKNLNYQPISDEILRTTLCNQEADTIMSRGAMVSDRLDNIIVNKLINIPEVDYNTCAKLLFKLARQVLDKFATYLSDEDIKMLFNIVQSKAKAAFINKICLKVNSSRGFAVEFAQDAQNLTE